MRDILAVGNINTKTIIESENPYEIRHVGSGDREEWNQLARKSSRFNIMQSYEWGEYKLSRGWKVDRVGIVESNKLIAGAQILSIPLINGLICISYIPRGPIIEPSDSKLYPILFNQIRKIGQSNRAIFVKIEPTWMYTKSVANKLEDLGFQESGHTNQPRTSLIIDINHPPEMLLSRMKRSTRYNIRLAKKKGVLVYEGNQSDLKTFYRLLKDTSERHHFPIRSYEYYHDQWNYFSPNNQITLLLADYQGDTVAARISMIFGKNAADIHAASNNLHPQTKANHLLVWESILRAKLNGCVSYDLWGIPDEIGENIHFGSQLSDNQEGLWGVYEFKKGFGGELVYYVGSFDYPINKFMYKILVGGIFGRFSIDQLVERFRRG